MGLQLVSLENNRAVIESDLPDHQLAIAELRSKAAKDFAIAEATKRGTAGAAIGVSGQPYPVDVAGREVVHGSAHTLHRYRVDIPVSATLR